MEGRTGALADMAASNTTHYGLAPFGSIPIKARCRPPQAAFEWGRIATLRALLHDSIPARVRPAFSIHGAVQIHPLASNLDERFIDPPAPTRWPLEPMPALFARFRIANDPTQDGGVRNR